ncbi:hypothetical protein [Acidovorax radicis]|uniref:hypothetical protein n=1 Tax=Acidovorax radicis TaxID=758826 RepID=UPI0002376646|nr:hypothetical protein [Acidovorax radicis]
MPHIYAINALNPILLSEVAVGSVVSFLDTDATLYVRVSRVPLGGGGTFIALDEKLTVARVSEENMKKFACRLPPGDLRVSLGAVAGRANDVLPGQIVLTADGPVLGVLESGNFGSSETSYVSMVTWEFVDFPAKSWRIQDCKLLWEPEDQRHETSTLLTFLQAGR